MRTRLLFIGPLISQLRKLQGFTIVEVTSVVCAVVILSAIAIIRIGDVRSAALDAQAKADAVQLQQAYDRAVNYQLDFLTNDSILIFATNAYDQALITQIPSPDSLAKIFLTPNSHITNDTAAFITQTNASDQTIPPPLVTITSPTSGQTFLAGQAILLSAAVSSLEYISQVVFLDNGTTVGAAAASPYNLTITTTAGSHTFAAIATSASGQTGNNQVTVTVNPNAPPLVYLNQPLAGSYPYTTPLTLQAVASDPNVGGGITKLSIFAGSNQIATTTSSTYSGTWYGSPGNYSLVAKAWDVANAMTASTPVAVTLLPNNPPTITLNSPTAGQSFMSPTTVPLRVTAVADGGPVVQVKYVITGGPTLSFTNFPFSYDWVNPVAGDYSIQAFAYDNTGAQGQSASNSITVTQDIPPTVSLESPTNGSSLLSPITISVTATATSPDSTIANVNLLINGNMVSSLTSSPYTYSWVNPYAGTYTIYAVAADDHGVTACSPTNQVTIAQDQAPSVVLVNPTNGETFLTPVTVPMLATATDPDDGVAYVDFIVDGNAMDSVTQSPYTFNWVNPISGTHTISAIAYDQHTLSTRSATITVIVNQDLPPTVTLTSPQTGTVLAPATIALSAAASPSSSDIGGSIAGVSFYTNGVLVTTVSTAPYFYNLNLPLAGGVYSIQAVATDDLGVTNASSAATITAVQDQPPSSVVLTSPTNGQSVLTPATVVLSATASDPDDGVARVDFVDGNNVIISLTSTPYNFNWPNPASGTHNLTAVAYDTKGLSLTSAVVSITVTADVAPMITLTSPSDGDIYLNPTNVVMSATAFSSLSSISKVQYIVDNSTFATVYSAPYTSSWTNPTYGSHVIYAIAYDNLGLSTSTPTVNIQAGTNYPPTIAWVTPTNGFSSIVPTNLTLQVTATDPQNEVILVTITDQYGDRLFTSTSATGPYSTGWTAGVGAYNLTATVYDQHGASDSATIQVAGIQSQAPSVALSAPTSGAVYVAPASVTITASANDTQTGNGVSMVELYANGTLIASTNADMITTNWSTGEGSYAITAKAYDNFTASQVSASVSITVQGPVTPVAILNSPANGTTFTNLDGGGASVSMGVTVTDSNPGSSISTIDFYDAGNQLTPPGNTATGYTNTTLANGSHALWVKVTDNYSQVGYSQTNTITIQGVASGDLAAPLVTISSSIASGSTVPTGTPINFQVTAANNGNGGSIANVQILVNDSSVATLATSPYTYTWYPASAETFSIEAVAFTALNKEGASTNISITAFVNQPPSVTLDTPVANQTFLGPTTMNFSATAAGSYGAIQRVDFYANGSLVGSASNSVAGYYSFAWINCAVGSYPVYAEAYDVYGASSKTPPITVNVSQLQPPTSVAITSPSSGSAFSTPYNLVIVATAVDNADGIAAVTILTNNVPLATLTTSPYSYNWVNPPAGGYNLTAIAQNNGGLTLTSAVVGVTIVAATTPAVTWNTPAPGTYRYDYPFSWQATPSDSFTPQSSLNISYYDNGAFVAQVNAANGWTMTNYIPQTGMSHSMVAWTTNQSGLAGSATNIVFVETNNPPTIVLNSPANGAMVGTSSNVTLQATASDPDGDLVQVVFYVDSVPIITNTTPSGSVFTSSAAFGIGSHTVFATALSYGFSIPSLTNIINSVHSAPQITINSPTNGSSFTLNSSVQFSSYAAPYDGYSITSVNDYVDGTPEWNTTTKSGLTNSLTTLSARGHTNMVIAIDTYGTSNTNTTTFTITHTPPLITFTSPANGNSFVQYVPVTVGFYATAYDGTTITNVLLYLDGHLNASNNIAGITNTASTNSVGSHTNMAVAMDSHGSSGTNTITYTITAYTAPSITLSPTNGALVSTTNTTITASAVDEVGQTLTSMAIYIGSVKVATNAGGSSSNYLSITTNLAQGTNLIYAVATDLSGTGYSSTNALNAQPFTPPVVTITNYSGNPVYTSIYQDGMPLVAVASSPVRSVASVQFYDNGTLLGNGTTSYFSIASLYAFNWQSASVGSHAVTAVATDSLGIRATNQLTVTVSPGYYNLTGATVGPITGTTWSYWYCTAANATPYNSGSRTPMTWQYSEWDSWGYSLDTTACPGISQDFSNPGTGYDSIWAFTAPQTGTITLNGVANLASSAAVGVKFKIWNGGTQVYPASGWQAVADEQYILVNTNMAVTAGSDLFVQLNADGNQNSSWFYMPITISYTGGTNTYSSPSIQVAGITNGQLFLLNHGYSLTATATDPNSGGQILQTSLQVDGTTLNAVYNSGSCSAIWTPTTTATHVITATACDNYGQSTTTNITVYPAPTVTISNPTSGSILDTASNTFTISASDNAGETITGMSMYVNGSQVYTTANSSISFTTNLTMTGGYTIYATASDAKGTGYSSTNSFIATNSVSVAITNPAAHASLEETQTYTLQASASTGSGVRITNVSLYTNGALLGSVTAAPWNYSWTVPSSATVSNLTAVAYDANGLSRTSAGIPIVIATTNNEPANYVNIALTGYGGSWSASSTYSTLVAANAFDGLTSTWWQPTSLSGTLQRSGGSGTWAATQTVLAFTIDGTHNITTDTITWSIDYELGTTWYDSVASGTMSSAKGFHPTVYLSSPINVNDVRLNISDNPNWPFISEFKIWIQ